MNFPSPYRNAAVPIAAAAAAFCTAIAATVIHLHARRKAAEDADLFEGIVGSPHFEASASGSARPPLKNQCDVPGVSDGCSDAAAAPVLIAEREAGLQLARDLLKQLYASEGLVFEEDDKKLKDDDGDETNVSLNYHIAMEIEKETREELIEAVVAGEVAKRTIGSNVQLSDFKDVLHRAEAYLDISNEREKLRARRSAAALDVGRPVWPADAQLDRQAPRAEAFPRVSELEERLGMPLAHDAEERFEMGWDEGGAGDSNEDEAELMAYLDQSDAAGYGSRMEARLAAMMDNNMGFFDGEDEDDYYDYDDEEEEEEGEGDTDDILAKEEFERMLLDKLQQLAMSVKTNVSHQPPASSDGAIFPVDEEGEWVTEED